MSLRKILIKPVYSTFMTRKDIKVESLRMSIHLLITSIIMLKLILSQEDRSNIEIWFGFNLFKLRNFLFFCRVLRFQMSED